MGWSCNRDAALTMDAITEFCVKSTGSSNVYENNGNKYMIEWSRREHRDGAITGTVYLFLPNEQIKKSTTIRIEGDGKISRSPAVLKSLTILKMIFTERGQERIYLYRGEETPTEESLYVEAVKYGDQYAEGGANAHIGKSLGYIPYPSAVKVVDLDGKTVAEWTAGMFQVYELPKSS